MARSEFIPVQESKSVYADANKRGKEIDPRVRKVIMLAVLLFCLVILVSLLDEPLFSSAGAYELGPARIGEVFSSHLGSLLGMFTGQNPGLYGLILTSTIIATLAGMALGTSGCVYQGTLKNALASPSTLGVIAGGELGMVIYILFAIDDTTQDTLVSQAQASAYINSLDPLQYLWMIGGKAFCSILGCFAVAGIVLLVARIAGRGKTSKVALIITGQVVASLVTTVVMVIRYYLEQTDAYGNKVQAIVTMNQGAIPFLPVDLLLMGIPVIIGLVILLRLRNRMNLLAFKDEEARSMGISTKRLRGVTVGICTLLTAVVISFCGIIGFVGFIVPHMARRIIGADFKFLLPASMLLGGMFVLLGSFIADLGLFDGAIKLGLLTNVLGAFVFVGTAIVKRRTGDVDWL